MPRATAGHSRRLTTGGKAEQICLTGRLVKTKKHSEGKTTKKAGPGPAPLSCLPLHHPFFQDIQVKESMLNGFQRILKKIFVRRIWGKTLETAKLEDPHSSSRKGPSREPEHSQAARDNPSGLANTEEGSDAEISNAIAA